MPTRTGTAIRACADNYTGAKVVGLDVEKLYALTFGLGSACVGAAGVMLACGGLWLKKLVNPEF